MYFFAYFVVIINVVIMLTAASACVRAIQYDKSSWKTLRIPILLIVIPCITGIVLSIYLMSKMFV